MGVDETGYLHSPLENFHSSHRAKLVPFAGWLMPLSYESERAEHAAVRSKVGLFDLSHMGEIVVEGKDAGPYLDHHLVSNIGSIGLGQAKYTLCCDTDGGILEDLIVYRIGGDRYLLIVNAVNAQFMTDRLSKRDGFDVTAENISKDYALIALQGPRSFEILQKAVGGALPDLKYYSIAELAVNGIQSYVARTGYTGEDGFEILCPAEAAESMAELLYSANGDDDKMTLCGLAARDSLRLEAGMALYGNELSREVNPFEAGLGRLVDFSKSGDFVGRDSLLAVKDIPPKRFLAGFVVDSGRPARHGYEILPPEVINRPAADNGKDTLAIGNVTSGAVSPTLRKSIGMGYVDSDFCGEGRNLCIKIRDKAEAAKIVNLPFYVRKKV